MATLLDLWLLLQGKGNGPLESANMLWLIQRDFLQGKTVQAMVAEALQPVANPGHDTDIEQVQRLGLCCWTCLSMCTSSRTLARTPDSLMRVAWPGLCHRSRVIQMTLKAAKGLSAALKHSAGCAERTSTWQC